MQLKTVGLLKDIPTTKDGKASDQAWRTANIKKPGLDWFNRLPFADIEHFNTIYNDIEGGIETDIVEFCPLCDSPLITLDNSNQVPFLNQNFFASTSSLTGRRKNRRTRKVERTGTASMDT